MCPYCGCRQWFNSWGAGNAECADCGKEYIVTFSDKPDLEGKHIIGKPTEDSVEQANERN